MTAIRLLLGRFGKNLFWVTSLALLVCLLVDGVERAGLVNQGRTSEWAALVLWRQPGLWRELLPLLVAVGIASGLAGLRSRRELTALAAAGVSPGLVTSVAVAAALIYSGFALGIVELVGPRALERVAEIELETRGESVRGSGGWWLLPQAALRVEAQEESFENLLWVESDQGRLTSIVEVARGEWQGSAWKLEEATRLSFEEGRPPLPQPVGELGLLGPEAMRLLGAASRPSQATLGMLRHYPPSLRGPWWHQRLAGVALPGLLALLLCLLGFRFPLGRASAVVVAVLLSSGTWLCMSTLARLSLSPQAAWGPVLVLGVVAILLRERPPS